MRAVDDLEHAEKLDGLVGLGQRWARLLRPGRSRDALYGVWLGHPLHPMLAQAPDRAMAVSQRAGRMAGW